MMFYRACSIYSILYALTFVVFILADNYSVAACRAEAALLQLFGVAVLIHEAFIAYDLFDQLALFRNQYSYRHQSASFSSSILDDVDLLNLEESMHAKKFNSNSDTRCFRWLQNINWQKVPIKYWKFQGCCLLFNVIAVIVSNLLNADGVQGSHLGNVLP
jgi:hypothetical protein